MPTYEFKCPQGHDFENVSRSMATAAVQIPCPICGAMAERQMSAGAGLVFKGSGFYITDYGKDGKKDQREAQVKADSTKASDAKVSDTKTGDAKTSDTKDVGSKPQDSTPSSSASAPTAPSVATKAKADE